MSGEGTSRESLHYVGDKNRSWPARHSICRTLGPTTRIWTILCFPVPHLVAEAILAAKIGAGTTAHNPNRSLERHRRVAAGPPDEQNPCPRHTGKRHPTSSATELVDAGAARGDGARSSRSASSPRSAPLSARSSASRSFSALLLSLR